ncbi:MAG: hypothetical protein ACLGGX_08485 [Bdellovibrionia bacterium]
MKDRSRMPANLEFSELGEYHLVNAYDELNAKVIHESVATGFDKDQNLAAIKSLVEFCERQAFVEGFKRNDLACLTERTDGLAAYPALVSFTEAREQAREKALHEAIERYAWTKWWDDKDTKYEILDEKNFLDLKPLRDQISEILPVSEAFVILPNLQDKTVEVLILVFFLKNGGVISGGACGSKSNRSFILQRAFAEISRHAIAVSRFVETNEEPITFYENRLLFFSSDSGEKIVRERLLTRGAQEIVLPQLYIDSEVKHSLSDIIYVHRCLFEGQPPFVGGALERFCI